MIIHLLIQLLISQFYMASIEKHDNKSIIIAYIFLIWGHALK